MTIEIPYILVQAIVYVAITYPMIGFYWSVEKVFWYFYTTFCTFLYFVYLGMLIVSLSLNLDLASILAAAVYTIFNLFSGFLMPGPVSHTNLLKNSFMPTISLLYNKLLNLFLKCYTSMCIDMWYFVIPEHIYTYSLRS